MSERNSLIELPLSDPIRPDPKPKVKAWQVFLILVLVFAGGFYLGLQQKTENVAVVGFDPGQFDEEWNKKNLDGGLTEETVNSTSPTPLDYYNATDEIAKRHAHYVDRCENRRRNLMSVNYRTGMVMRWGRSLGGVNFMTCFLPKAASSSMSATMLLATGWIDKSQKNHVTDSMWDQGRNHCISKKATCLHEFNKMPQKYRYMGAKLPPGDKFVSLIVAREPMSRLVSAWKDKIYRRTEREFYFSRYTKSMLKYMGKRNCPKFQAAAWDAGCRVPFADFVGWLTLGNKAADEHWTPAAELCVACQANYTFIGHSEHFSDDIKVAAKMLEIPTDVLPTTYYSTNPHAASLNSDTVERKTTEDYFRDVKKSTIRKIREIYRADYDFFGYEMPEWLEKA